MAVTKIVGSQWPGNFPPVQNEMADAIDLNTTHRGSTANPHNVTAAQAGAEPSGAVESHRVNGVHDLHTHHLRGTLANRPAAGVIRRIYEVAGDATASNNGRTFWDTGAEWLEVAFIDRHDTDHDAHNDLRYPRGQLAYAQVTALQTGITTEVDLTGLSVTITVPASRRIQLIGNGLFQSTVSDDIAGMDTYEDGARRQAGRVLTKSNSDATLYTSVVFTPTAGSHTYKLTALRAAGSGSIQLTAVNSAPAFILVEDIGPA